MTEIPPDAWRITLKRRLLIAAAIMAACVVAIEARLIYLQVFQRAAWAARAERQQSDTDVVRGTRGEILDRRGRPFALSVDVRSISGHPREIESPPRAVAAICAALGDCTEKERAQMLATLSSRKNHVFIRRQLPREQAERVEALELKGVAVKVESDRFYPFGELAAHVVGHVNVDQKGQSGIEAARDSLVRGEPGRVIVRTDAKGVPFSTHVLQAPTVGKTLELTIDANIQHVVERELRAGIEENRAHGGSVVVLDPSTGEILALANYPTFNPNFWERSSASALVNRAIANVYEPGSTYKMVTAAAALEHGIVDSDDVIDVSGGRIQIGSHVIDDVHPHKSLTFADVIIKSSNVGAIRVAQRLGAARLGQFTERFGFGRRLSPGDFPGGTAGIVPPAGRLSELDLANVAIGYHIAVTPLQMVAAVGAIANGGEFAQPYLLRAIIDNGARSPMPRVPVRRATTESVAAKLTTMMEGVVQSGTATLAQIPGHRIAAKTGTAAKAIRGGYSKSEYNASIVGFFPVEQPKYAVVVVIDSPRGPNGYYGGTVAAPIFRRIAAALLRDAGVPRSVDAPPPVMVRRAGPLREIPASGAIVSTPQAANGAAVLPDVTGLSGRAALASLGRYGVTARMHGTGVVISQTPSAGTPLGSDTVATLWLTRQATRAGETATQ